MNKLVAVGGRFEQKRMFRDIIIGWKSRMLKQAEKTQENMLGLSDDSDSGNEMHNQQQQQQHDMASQQVYTSVRGSNSALV